MCDKVFNHEFCVSMKSLVLWWHLKNTQTHCLKVNFFGSMVWISWLISSTIHVAEVLPLVEFTLEEGMTDEEAEHILNMSIPKQKKKGGPWSETRMSSILDWAQLKQHTFSLLFLPLLFGQPYLFCAAPDRWSTLSPPSIESDIGLLLH